MPEVPPVTSTFLPSRPRKVSIAGAVVVSVAAMGPSPRVGSLALWRVGGGRYSSRRSPVGSKLGRKTSSPRSCASMPVSAGWARRVTCASARLEDALELAEVALDVAPDHRRHQTLETPAPLHAVAHRAALDGVGDLHGERRLYGSHIER